jgi:hypothetical protein
MDGLSAAEQTDADEEVEQEPEQRQKGDDEDERAHRINRVGGRPEPQPWRIL